MNKLFTQVLLAGFFLSAGSAFGQVIISKDGKVIGTQKEIVDGDVQGDRRHDVIGFATANDLLSLEQNQAGHQQDKHTGNRESQSRQLEKQVADCGQERDQDAYHQEFAHKREIPLAGQRQT